MFFRHHVWNCGTAAVEDGRKIRSKNLIPVIVSHVSQKSEPGDTGIVDQNINATTLFFNNLKNLPDFVGVTDISGNCCTGTTV